MIGFDVIDLNASSASQHHDDDMLLRPVDRILSTDRYLMPSVFDGDKPWRELPEWRGSRQNRWDDLAELRRTLDSNQDVLPEGFALVAITQLANPGAPYDLSAAESGSVNASSSCRPAKLDPTWQLIGYDVSDFFLLSGLSNCGDSPDEQKELAAKFGPHLSEHHLFDSLEVANEFREVSDARVPEHAPFYVYGIHLGIA